MSKITKIEVQAKNKNRFNLYIDDKFFMGVSEDTLVNLNLKKGMKINKDSISSIVYNEEISKCFHYATYLLGFRLRSKAELRNRLKQKGYDEFIIEDVIYKLENLSYINDESFIDAFIKTRINQRKYGKIKIKMDLIEKGLDVELIDRKLEELYSYELELEIANEVFNKKIKSYKEKYNDKYKINTMIYNFLYRRGFNSNIIKNTIDLNQ